MISRFVLRLYDRMSSRRSLLFCLLSVLTAGLALSALRQTYKEDISDFLPLSSRQGDAMKVYQDISGAQRIFAVFQCSDSARTEPDSITAAIDDFVAAVQRDSVLPTESVTAVVDVEEMMRLSDYVCNNIPYFLLPEDYRRMDSLLAREGYIAERMSQNRQLLMLPGSGTTARMLCRDPLMLFTPALSALQTGVVDGAEQPVPNYMSNAFQEVAPNLIRDEHTLGVIEIVISDGAYDSLTENQQKVLADAAVVAQDYDQQVSQQTEDETIEKLKAAGVNIVDVPDKTPWQEACKNTIDSATKDNADLYQKILDLAN